MSLSEKCLTYSTPMYKILSICLLFCTIRVSAQLANDYHHRFAVEELREDLQVLRDSLAINHPALYRFTSRKKLDGAFDKAGQGITHPLTQVEFYGLIAPLVGMVGDIHTTVEVADASFNYLVTQSKLFPLGIRIIRGQVYVAGNNSMDTTIPAGSRILKINDQPVVAILHKIKSYFSDEGMNETLKTRRSEQRFAYQYHFAFGYCDGFKVEYVGPDGKMIVKKVAAEPYQTLIQNWTKNKSRYPQLKPLSIQPPYLQLSFDLNRHAAIIKIGSFQNDILQQSNEQFKPFIDSVFAEIRAKNISNLVVDIRGNEGGESSNASYLYSYVTRQPFRFLYAMETNRNTYLEDSASGVKYSAIGDSYRTTDTVTTIDRFFGLHTQQPAVNNSFDGRLYVLINGLTSSAAPQFASLVKLNARGILVGETAPGSLYGGSGRGYSYFYLPHSGLLTMISRYRLYLSHSSKKYSNVAPDIKPVYTITDVLNGTDRDMEAVMKLMK